MRLCLLGGAIGVASCRKIQIEFSCYNQNSVCLRWCNMSHNYSIKNICEGISVDRIKRSVLTKCLTTADEACVASTYNYL
jgi:hypothetical protein